MARKAKSPGSKTGAGSGDPAQAIRDSAQKIWLAGLGAFERAKSEGPRMFETLVEQGKQMGSRAQQAADEAWKNVRDNTQAGARWDKLEQVFEDRVSKSLGRLGVLTARDVEDLSRQVRELNETVARMMARGGGGGGGGAKAGGRKKAAPRKKAKRKARAKAPSTPA